MINCRSKNTANALNNAPGTIIDRWESNHPISPITMYKGIIVTCFGIIMVARKRINITFDPGNRIFANAYAAIEVVSTVVRTTTPVI
ncbi:hypothetical protein D3C81_1719870 [compost metagenome]